MEELHTDSLSDAHRRDPSTLAALAEARSLEGKDVVDVNGIRLGKVTTSFAEEGMLVKMEVTLSENAKGILGAEQEVAGVPADAIARVEGDEVLLRQAGEQIVRPEDPRPIHATDDLRGAPERPRKNR